MKATCNFFFRLIFAAVFMAGSFINAATKDEPQIAPNPRKKTIPKITLKNISPPFLDHDYYRDYKEFGFDFNATSFNLINAWWLAEASTLVYADENFVRKQFSRVGLKEVIFFDQQSTQCFVASNDKFAIVAFRGSEIWKRKEKFDFNKTFADLKADVDIRLTECGSRPPARCSTSNFSRRRTRRVGGVRPRYGVDSAADISRCRWR